MKFLDTVFLGVFWGFFLLFFALPSDKKNPKGLFPHIKASVILALY